MQCFTLIKTSIYLKYLYNYWCDPLKSFSSLCVPTLLEPLSTLPGGIKDYNDVDVSVYHHSKHGPHHHTHNHLLLPPNKLNPTRRGPTHDTVRNTYWKVVTYLKTCVLLLYFFFLASLYKMPQLGFEKHQRKRLAWEMESQPLYICLLFPSTQLNLEVTILWHLAFWNQVALFSIVLSTCFALYWRRRRKVSQQEMDRAHLNSRRRQSWMTGGLSIKSSAGKYLLMMLYGRS